VFSPDAGWTLLIHLTQALNGNHLSRGRSWLAGSEEAAVASALVTIRDDGRLAEGPNSAPFDGEGTDVRDRALVEQGRVRGQMLDLASSRRLGRTSTGNSQRGGYEQLPDIGPHNLYMVPGSSTPERMIAGVDRGLWIWALSGWWIGMDPSNPEFSSAASGLWIENGKPVRPVARVTVAGRLTEILGAIEEIGNDLTWDHGVKTPTFKTGPLAISGV
jgi:PmbA protein